MVSLTKKQISSRLIRFEKKVDSICLYAVGCEQFKLDSDLKIQILSLEIYKVIKKSHSINSIDLVRGFQLNLTKKDVVDLIYSCLCKHLAMQNFYYNYLPS